MFYAFILIIFSLFSSLQASNRVFNEATFADAQCRLEVQSLSPTTLQIRLQEGLETLLDQTVMIGQASNYRTPTCTLTSDRNRTGFQLAYIGVDGTSLKVHIDAQATIDVLPNGSGIINTGFDQRKSWGFKTPGVWRNGQDNVTAFYNLITEVKEFHNLGLLQVRTGHFAQSYHFNKGVFHLGVSPSQVGINAYAPYAEWLQSQASPQFQAGTTENYGVILAEQGLGVRHLSFNDYGYAQAQFLDLDNAPLTLEQKEPSSAGPLVHIAETITGRTPQIRVGSKTGVLSVGSVGPNLAVQDWTNHGFIQTLSNSEFAPTQTWNNQGHIFGHGNVTLRNQKKPQSLGSVIASGSIKSIIEAALSDTEFDGVHKTAKFASRQSQVIVDVVTHIDHLLNTITTTDHYVVNRQGHRRFSHQTQTETGYQFQRRETQRTQQVIPGATMTTQGQVLHDAMKAQHFARQAMLDRLKDAMRKIGRFSGEQSGLLGVLLQGLRDAGLSASDIQSLIDDAEIGNALLGLTMLDSLPPSNRSDYLAAQTDSGWTLNYFATQAQRMGLSVLDWAKRSGPDLVGHFCDAMTLLAPIPNPAIRVATTACGVGKFSLKTREVFNGAQPFFSKRHEGGGKRQGQSSGGSGSSIQQKPFGTYEGTAAPYHHPNSSGLKSPAPKNGQEVLNSSVTYGSKGHRIGVDSKNKEIVVFMRHDVARNTYHGHTRTWDCLEPAMQKALRESGKVRVLGSGNKIKFSE